VADGFQHLDDGRPDLAEARFAAALSASPQSRWAHAGSGIASGRMGRHAAAVEHFDAAAGLGSASPALPLAHAFALRSAGRLVDARAAYDALVDLDGDLLEVAQLLDARLLHDEGRFDDAEAELLALVPPGLATSVVGLVGDVGRPAGGGAVPFVLDGIGWVRWAKGDVQGAKEAFRDANAVGAPLHITPHLLGWSHLGEALTQIVQGEASRRILDSLELARRDSSAAAASLALEALVRAGASCADAAGPARASLDIVPGFALAAWVLSACSEAPDGRLAPAVELLAGGDLPELRALPTPAVQQWFDPTDMALITSDLERALDRIQALGARPVLLTYPQPAAHDEIAEAVLRLGARTGATVVDPRGVFASAHSRGRPWSELYIPDGHPTTAGYSMIGELVASALEGPP
jgi:tetratricopeptide (TPR) repeat protein